MNRICQKNFLKFMMLLLFASLFFAVSGSIETYATNPTTDQAHAARRPATRAKHRMALRRQRQPHA